MLPIATKTVDRLLTRYFSLLAFWYAQSLVDRAPSPPFRRTMFTGRRTGAPVEVTDAKMQTYGEKAIYLFAPRWSALEFLRNRGYSVAVCIVYSFSGVYMGTTAA